MPTDTKTIMSITLGSSLEAYDIIIFAYFSHYIALTFFNSHNPHTALFQTYLVFFISMFIRPFFGFLFGYIGDKLGRKPAFTLSVLLSSLATIIILFLPGYSSLGILSGILLFIARIAQAAAISGEYVGGIIYLVEIASKKKEALYSSYAVLGANIGMLLASIICLFFQLFEF